MQNDNDLNTYDEQFEEKRRAINELAIDQYTKTGKLSGKELLREYNEMDGELNKQLLAERLAQYQSENS